MSRHCLAIRSPWAPASTCADCRSPWSGSTPTSGTAAASSPTPRHATWPEAATRYASSRWDCATCRRSTRVPAPKRRCVPRWDGATCSTPPTTVPYGYGTASQDTSRHLRLWTCSGWPYGSSACSRCCPA